jgi:hypothetical protein
VAEPALIAQHSTEAAQAEKAIGYWLKAGRQALARSAMLEAETLLRKGLSLVSGLTDSVWRKEYELDLQIAFGGVLFQIQGFHAPDEGPKLLRKRAKDPIDCERHWVLVFGDGAGHVISAHLKVNLRRLCNDSPPHPAGA